MLTLLNINFCQASLQILTFFNVLTSRRHSMTGLRNFIYDEDGLTAIEYVIAASSLVAGLTTLFIGFGDALQLKLTDILASF